ncbi:MAG: aquaporin [Phycisphaerales bacterium]|nr:MAG: aquaporin [Phycisphaerales bacterium]
MVPDSAWRYRTVGDLARPCLAEMLGTFIFVFVGTGAVLVAHWRPELGLLGVAAAHGFILAAMVTITLPLGGGHLNPAITVALVAGGRVRKHVALAYIASQLAGAAMGGAVLGILFGTGLDPYQMGDVLSFAADEVALGTPSYAPTVISPIAAVMLEALLTFALVLVTYAVLVDPRRPRMGGVFVGLAYAALMLVGEPFTGAAMNPARAFGPLIAGGRLTLHLWSQHWVYWAGPLAGALIAAALYEAAFMPRPGRSVAFPVVTGDMQREQQQRTAVDQSPPMARRAEEKEAGGGQI